MSQMLSNSSGGIASTSTAPHLATPASYHPLPRPQPLPPLVRVDTQAIKQELHDALGENGLAYWKAVNGYLVGQLSKRELEGMIKGWLKGDKLILHNKLLISLLHNASTPSQAPSSALLARKRKRVPHYDPEFDIDDVLIEPKLRISQWIGALTNRDRGRLKRGIAQSAKAAEEEAAAGDGDVKGEGEDGEGKIGEDPDVAKRKQSTYTPNLNLPSISIPDRSLPSSLQLTSRIQAIANANDLRIPDDPDDIAEFFSVGVDEHVSGILQSVVRLTGRERPGTESIQVPQRRPSHPSSYPEETNHPHPFQREHASPALPEPDVETFHNLFNLNPGNHPTPSPALYQLRTGHTLGQIEAHGLHKIRQQPSHHLDILSRPASPSVPNGHTGKHPNHPNHLNSVNGHISPPSSPPPKPIVPMNHNTSHYPTLAVVPPAYGSAFVSHRAEAVGRNLLESGLLKIEVPDKGEEDKEGGKGKKKKHGLHWKYEDPAFLLRDILG